MQRFAKPLIYVLIAAQLLLAIPAMSWAAESQANAAQHPCAGMTLEAGDDHCPCCPDGADSMKDCIAACMMSAALPSATLVLPMAGSPMHVAVAPASIYRTFHEPPLKPPPIA